MACKHSQKRMAEQNAKRLGSVVLFDEREQFLTEKFNEKLSKTRPDFTWHVLSTPRQDLRKQILAIAPTSLLITTTRGSRQHFQSVLGREPEEFAAAFSGSLGIIHLP